MFFVFIFGLFICGCSAVPNYYETYTGKPISEEEYKQHVKRNTSFWCTNEILPCSPLEGRRVDGSCNNLKYFTMGAPHTPFYRLLPPVFSEGYEPRLTKAGEKMPLARGVRTNMLAEGRVPDLQLTQMFTHFLVFFTGDFVSLHDTVNYIIWKPYCCLEKGKQDYACVPNAIPNDDPVHRFSNVRCYNMTRPETYQSVKCVANNTIPERISTSTPLLDLSHIYGNSMRSLNEKGRLFKDGLLKFEIEAGKIWPPSSKGPNLCYANQKPHETRCHDTPEDGPNTILGINLMTIWIWRYHNIIASALSSINPCWNDERLFFTTREIVIASIMQISFYELLPAIMGYNNLVHDGVLCPDLGFRDIYNENLPPQISLEFPFAWRWTHTIQEGVVKLYDDKGYHLKDTKLVNMTLRTGYLVDNIDGITQGAIRQANAKFDYVVDPDMAEVVLGPHQHASDVFTSDLAKNRQFLFPPYIKYREFCFGKTINSFNDLLDAIGPERLELIREKYKAVEDIDLIVGLWLENYIPGGRVPSTFYCIIVQQLLRSIASDRHWYERPNRPNAFTIDQLLEIRKSTISGLLCSVADSITEVQPRAFYRAGPGNEMVSCDQIPKMNIWAWQDPTCKTNPYQFKQS
ncbi:peroxidase-like [Zerene cesonia]|uniref:peroxidase-like n=1 Tax=Zerene cesonia TaxID=33412 RepID=UPI0018E57F0B|nr:peroxidase-like [Zerene cesonia]